ISVVCIVFEDVCAKCDLTPCLAEQLTHLQRDRLGEFVDLLSQERRRLLEDDLARRNRSQTPVSCVCFLGFSDDRFNLRIGVLRKCFNQPFAIGINRLIQHGSPPLSYGLPGTVPGFSFSWKNDCNPDSAGAEPVPNSSNRSSRG